MKAFFILVCSLLFLVPAEALAQHAGYAFRVYFKDKAQTPYALDAATDYLSPRSIDRRSKFGIAIDSSDLPVSQRYIDDILQTTSGTLKVVSKWQNTAVILLADSGLIQNLYTFNFVAGVKLVAVFNTGEMSPPADVQKQTGSPGTEAFYGYAWEQIQLCKGQYLHENGYLGEGMLIGVIDAGFQGVNSISAFDSLRESKRLIDVWSFLNDSADFSFSDHGTQVLSCMAAYLPDEFVGTAPKAEYALYTTDNVYTEHTIEEDYWIAAAERADSIGADVITTSLGYNYFDEQENSYSYADLDGRSTFIAQAANAAVRKGIMTIASAGNEGTSAWHYILTPGDADSVFTIGSVDAFEDPAESSGYGPNASQTRKPDVMGLGQGAMTINKQGSVGSGYGTSFATPVIAGLTACLMQARPDLPPFIIREQIRSLSDHYSNPNDKVGFGIPDFKASYDRLTTISKATPVQRQVIIYPNPAGRYVHVRPDPKDKLQSAFFSDATGRLLKAEITDYINGSYIVSMASFPVGFYLLHLNFEDYTYSEKIIKLQE